MPGGDSLLIRILFAADYKIRGAQAGLLTYPGT